MSSSAPAPRAACSRTASRRTAVTPCCSSSTAAPIARSSCRCPRRSRSRWGWRGTTGATSPSRNPALAVADCTRRAARCWGALRRSTALSTCAAMRRTRTLGGGRRRGMELRIRAALLPARRDAGRGWQRIPRRSGPLQTRYGTLSNPLHAAWLLAGTQAGYRETPDVNGYQQEGFGRLDMTVSPAGALQRGECVPASRHDARQPCRAHADARDAHPVRGAACGRHRISPRRRDATVRRAGK